MVECGSHEETKELNENDPCGHLPAIPGQKKLFSVLRDGSPAYACCVCPAGERLTNICR